MLFVIYAGYSFPEKTLLDLPLKYSHFEIWFKKRVAQKSISKEWLDVKRGFATEFGPRHIRIFTKLLYLHPTNQGAKRIENDSEKATMWKSHCWLAMLDFGVCCTSSATIFSKCASSSS